MYLIEARHLQMFPVLEASEIGRIARLGEHRNYTAGTHIFTIGEVAPGAFVLLSGLVVSRSATATVSLG